VLDLRLGRAHLELAPSAVGTWSPQPTVPAYDPTVTRPPGFRVQPALAVLFARPVTPGLTGLLELDASYAPGLDTGFVALTVGVVRAFGTSGR